MMMLEGRVVFEFLATVLATPLLTAMPRGDGHCVVLIPGFMQDGSNMLPMQRYLEVLGYETRICNAVAHGVTVESVVRYASEIDSLARTTGAPVSIIGWSLGGLIARALASQRPRSIRQVITLGSPFSGDPADNALARIFGCMSGVLTAPVEEQVASAARQSLTIPSSSIYSRSDGIVPWQNCIDASSGPYSENIEVMSSHAGLGVHPMALLVIANRLQQPTEGWHPLPTNDGKPCLTSLLPSLFNDACSAL
jgi:hypothetical protein